MHNDFKSFNEIMEAIRKAQQERMRDHLANAFDPRNFAGYKGSIAGSKVRKYDRAFLRACNIQGFDTE